VLLFFNKKNAAQTNFIPLYSPTPNYYKWHEYTNDTIKLVFRSGLEKEALNYGQTMMWQCYDSTFSLGKKVRNLNILLHTENAQSNGYVKLAPYQSEFYLTPMHNSGELGSINFGSLLSIHEYRHALQYSNSLRGFSKFLYLLSGQQGWAIFHHLVIPNWFSEGDAVLTETAFSRQGRGRIPYFLNDYRFLALSNVSYKYIKARNGSLKHFVPNHYTLGYLICRNGIDKYGKEIWKNVFTRTNKGTPLLFSFKRAFKKEVGISLNSFYDETINNYYNNWLKDTIITENQYAQAISKESKIFTSYSYPQYTEENEIIALKKSLNELPEFIKIYDDGREQKITLQGISSDSYFNYKNNKIVYTEIRIDKRYSNLNYNEIVLLDIKNKKKKTLTNLSKSFAPSFNKEGDKIVYMRYTDESNSILVEINLKGEILNEISNKDNFYYTFPKYLDDGNIVSAIRNKEGQMSICLINPKNNEHRNLFPFNNNIIEDLTTSGNHIYFVSSFDGKDQLYTIDNSDGKIKQIISRIQNCYMPCINNKGDFILYTELNNKGRAILQSELNEFNFQEKKVIELEDLFTFQSENFNLITTDINPVTSAFKLKSYKKYKNLINIHSWRPDVNRGKIGLNLYSDNLLNTLNLEVGVFRNLNEHNTFYNFSATYSGLYPVLKIESNIIPQRTIILPENENLFADTNVTEKNFKFNTYIPLIFTKGLYESKFQIGGGYQYINLSNLNINIANTNIQALTFSLNYLKALRKASQHFVSRKAIYIQTDYLRSINTNSEQFTTQTELSIRGISKNDVFIVNGSLLKQRTSSGYQFFNSYGFSRGIQIGGVDRFYKISLNYQFALAYPDGGINGIFYLYRVRLNPFLDLGWAQAFNNNSFNKIQTAGLEIIADLNIFNTLPIKVGIRYSYIFNSNYLFYKSIPFQVFIPVYFF
jgi:hypothetical protein